jgi:hypothetical protein
MDEAISAMEETIRSGGTLSRLQRDYLIVNLYKGQSEIRRFNRERADLIDKKIEKLERHDIVRWVKDNQTISAVLVMIAVMLPTGLRIALYTFLKRAFGIDVPPDFLP